MISLIKRCIIENIGKGQLKIHFSRIDYRDNVKYDTICGVWCNDKLIRTFEFENITNKEIDEIMNELKRFSREKLYLV